MTQRIAVLTFAALIASSTSTTSGRHWTDPTGKFSIEAEFVAFDPPREERIEEGGKQVVKKIEPQVRLRKADGKEISVPLARLSDADQKHVRSLYRELQKLQQQEERELEEKKRLAPFLGSWESTSDLGEILAVVGIPKTNQNGEKSFSEKLTFRPNFTGIAEIRVGERVVTYELKFKVNAKNNMLTFASPGANGDALSKDEDTLYLRAKFVGTGITTSTLNGTFKRLPENRND